MVLLKATSRSDHSSSPFEPFELFRTSLNPSWSVPFTTTLKKSSSVLITAGLVTKRSTCSTSATRFTKLSIVSLTQTGGSS